MFLSRVQTCFYFGDKNAFLTFLNFFPNVGYINDSAGEGRFDGTNRHRWLRLMESIKSLFSLDVFSVYERRDARLP